MCPFPLEQQLVLTTGPYHCIATALARDVTMRSGFDFYVLALRTAAACM